MIRLYGIDSSVLVRLLTGDPEKDFQHCVSRLRAPIDEQGSEIFASNQVVGEVEVLTLDRKMAVLSDVRRL